MSRKPTINVVDYIKCRTYRTVDPVIGTRYTEFFPSPCKGKLFVTENSPHFIHGRMMVKGNKDGVYPSRYLEFIDTVFGKEPNTIEVCSRTVKVDDERTAFTVDINPDFNPSMVCNAETLEGVESGRFNRWRGDPPYRGETAKDMYNTDLPSFIRLLEAGARVCKPGSLMFLLLGSTNYQACPKDVVRVGLIYISVIPNQETRALNIYLKLPVQPRTSGLDSWLRQ